jgi:hypothetical protein
LLWFSTCMAPIYSGAEGVFIPMGNPKGPVLCQVCGVTLAESRFKVLAMSFYSIGIHSFRNPMNSLSIHAIDYVPGIGNETELNQKTSRITRVIMLTQQVHCCGCLWDLGSGPPSRGAVVPPRWVGMGNACTCTDSRHCPLLPNPPDSKFSSWSK